MRAGNFRIHSQKHLLLDQQFIRTRRFPPLRGSNLLASHGPGEFAWEKRQSQNGVLGKLRNDKVENNNSIPMGVMISTVSVHVGSQFFFHHRVFCEPYLSTEVSQGPNEK